MRDREAERGSKFLGRYFKERREKNKEKRKDLKLFQGNE